MPKDKKENPVAKKKRDIVYAFIDSQNLNLGTNKDIIRHGKKIYHGWQLDFRKFRIYLADKFRVTKAFLCIGYIRENRDLYKQLRSYGFELIFKPTVRDSFGKPKGNIDAELVLYSAAIEYKNYDKAVIVSGDGDFACLHQYLLSNHKLAGVIIPNRFTESSLLRKFHQYKTFIIREKDKLKKERH